MSLITEIVRNKAKNKWLEKKILVQHSDNQKVSLCTVAMVTRRTAALRMYAEGYKQALEDVRNKRANVNDEIILDPIEF